MNQIAIAVPIATFFFFFFMEVAITISYHSSRALDLVPLWASAHLVNYDRSI